MNPVNQTTQMAGSQDISRPNVRPTFRRLAKRIEIFFFEHRNKLKIVHAGMFILFLAIVLGPVFLPDPPEDANPLTHFTTFANYVMWGLWFPLVFLSVIFTGRSWCGIMCPMGAASEWANGVGLKRAIPRWLSWEGTPIVSFLFITVLGQTVGVRDHPEAIAEVFGGTILMAIVIGYFYGKRKRAWCRHMCPIGLLLGVFSRIGAVQFTPKRKAPGGDRWTEKGVCPTMIDLPRKEESRHCIECFRCVNPNAKGTVAMRLRPPGEEVENIRDHHPNGWEIIFFFLGTGIAIGGFLWLILPHYMTLRLGIAEFFIDREQFWVGDPGPSWLMSVHPDRREVFNWIDFFSIITFMSGFMVLFSCVLTITTGISAWLSGKFGGDKTFRSRFIELGYQYAPIAMVSLVIGLGSELFNVFGWMGFGEEIIGWSKGILFGAAWFWCIRLGYKILENQGVKESNRWLAMVPGTFGSLMVGLAWWPAIFGL